MILWKLLLQVGSALFCTNSKTFNVFGKVFGNMKMPNSKPNRTGILQHGANNAFVSRRFNWSRSLYKQWRRKLRWSCGFGRNVFTMFIPIEFWININSRYRSTGWCEMTDVLWGICKPKPFFHHNILHEFVEQG